MTGMPRRVSAQRGTTLRCRGWRQETILRLLENNLENAENPDALVVYMSVAKAARDWECYERIVAALGRLETGQTLVMQSGKPIGIFQTRSDGPLVVMANGNLVPAWSSDDHVDEFVGKGLTIVPGFTAAAWQYIGSQGIVQGTYETFMACARKHFGGSMKGRWLLTGGCGGMGGAQPLAGVMAGAATLVVEADPAKIQRRIDTGYCQHMVPDLDAALKLVLAGKSAGTPISVGLVGNCADVLPEILRRNLLPDVVTDQTSTEPVGGYIPASIPLEETRRLWINEPESVKPLVYEAMRMHVEAMSEFQRRGSVVFEYGNNLRNRATVAGGAKHAFEIPSFVDLFLRPYFCEGIGPFRWIAVSGDPADIHAIDELVLREFTGNEQVRSWIRKAREFVKFQGLPARIAWLGHGERSRLAVLVNGMVARGELNAPIAFTRDHLDAASAAMPYRETENMRDGSDAIADWPILNALLNGAAGADLVTVHQLGDYGQSAGVTLVADGTAGAAVRLQRVLDCDTGLGVLRLADAGYETALAAKKRHALGL
ncbi:MAG: urocanate hydratase [Betaproteobacteria bacterium]|nr:urocanate hydratase [Betaproteobacteria bacterium]